MAVATIGYPVPNRPQELDEAECHGGTWERHIHRKDANVLGNEPCSKQIINFLIGVRTQCKALHVVGSTFPTSKR